MVTVNENILTLTSNSFIELGQWQQTALRFAETTTPHIPLVLPFSYGTVEASLILMKVNPTTGFIKMMIDSKYALEEPPFLGWVDYQGPGSIKTKLDSWTDEKLYERTGGIASPHCKSTAHLPSRERIWRTDISQVGPVARRHEFALQLYNRCFFCYIDDIALMNNFASLIPDPEPSAW